MSKLNDVSANLMPTDAGKNFVEVNDALAAYGISRKDVDKSPIVIPSMEMIGAGETIGRMTFFDKKNPLSHLKGVEFPDKLSAYDIHTISAEVEVNFAENQQENLRQLYHFAKTSQVALFLNRKEIARLPLQELMPIAIEMVGNQYRTRKIRDGFEFPEELILKISQGGNFQIVLEPAPGYKTSTTLKLGIPGADKDTEGANYIMMSLFGQSITAIGS